MALKHFVQRLGGDDVNTPRAVRFNRRLKPSLIDPELNLALSNAKRDGQTFERETVASDISKT